jgi:hypothetical protein
VSFLIHVDRDGVRSTHDADPDATEPVQCVTVRVAAGTSKTEALRWLGQALREVSDSYEPAPAHQA